MDLSTFMQNLRLTRSPSPEYYEGEVTLQRLPNHTRASYEQIETLPGEDIFKHNFGDLLSRSHPEISRSSFATATPAVHQQRAPSASNHLPTVPHPPTASAERAFHPELESRHTDGPHTRSREPTFGDNNRDSSEEERREQELRRSGRLDDGHLPGPSPTTVLPRNPNRIPLTAEAAKSRIGLFLRFYGVNSTQASKMTDLIKGQNVDDDYSAMMKFVPMLGAYECSFIYLSKSIRQILEGGNVGPPQTTTHQSKSGQRERLEDEDHTTPEPWNSPSPSSVSTLASGLSGASANTVTGATATPSRGQIPAQNPFDRLSVSVSSQLHSQTPAFTPTSLFSTQSRAPASSLTAGTAPAVAPPPMITLPNYPPLPPLSVSQSRDPARPDTSASGISWGTPQWDSRQSTASATAAPAPAVPSVRPRSPPTLFSSSTPTIPPPPPLPTTSGGEVTVAPSPLPSLHPLVSPLISPLAPPSPPLPPSNPTPILHPSSASPNSSITAQVSHPVLTSSVMPVTPARASVSSSLFKKESSTPSVSRSPSASPSTSSLFRSDPQRELITTRGNTSLKTYMFTASSSTRVTEPPTLKAGQVPQSGDLLFNKIPSSNATWEHAQVWIWTTGDDGNPGWEDIEEFYGSIENPIRHPRDGKRYLTKNKRDGRPGWVTLTTIKSYISQAAKSEGGEEVEDLMN